MATFVSLINRAADKGDMRMVVHWMDELRKHGLKPDVVIYTCLLGDRETVEFWINEVEKASMQAAARLEIITVAKRKLERLI